MDILEDCRYLKDGECRLIFLDKNHPGNSLDPVLEAIENHLPRKIARQLVYLTPPETKNATLPHLPFSLSFMAQVLANGALRENHPTLDNRDLANAFAVIIMFAGFNWNTSFDVNFLNKYMLDNFMRVPLIKEKQDLQNDMELSMYLQAVIADAANPKNNFTVKSKRMPDLVKYV